MGEYADAIIERMIDYDPIRYRRKKDRNLALVNKTTLFITGKLSWCKILGEPVPNFNKDGREWTFEVEPNEAGIQKLLKAGLADRIKGAGYNIGTKGQHKDRPPFIQLKKTELSKDGNPNTPIRIYDADQNEWDKETLIGNGSIGDVKLDVRNYGAGKKLGVYPVAIRVTEHVPYESSEFGALDEEEGRAPAKKDTFREDFGLDDEIPL